jgi:hypothetical protein
MGRKEAGRWGVLYNEMMDDFLSLPDFDEDEEPDVEGHALEPLTDAADADDADDLDDDVEGHGQSPFR